MRVAIIINTPNTDNDDDNFERLDDFEVFFMMERYEINDFHWYLYDTNHTN
jgi:hypothetical protein